MTVAVAVEASIAGVLFTSPVVVGPTFRIGEGASETWQGMELNPATEPSNMTVTTTTRV